MAEASRRARARGRTGGLPNALFVVAAAEAPPGRAARPRRRGDLHLPWGSLLRGALALDDACAAGIARLAAPAGASSSCSPPRRVTGCRATSTLSVARVAAASPTTGAPRLEPCARRDPATDPEIAAADRARGRSVSVCARIVAPDRDGVSAAAASVGERRGRRPDARCYPPPMLGGPPDRTASAPRILIVDDDPNLLVILADQLRADGYEVATARDGDEALRRLRQAGRTC